MANERDGHVFLSHAGVDTAAAHEFAEILRRSGLSVWFDKDSIQPGDPWMTALEQAIQEASAMIVYVGRLGVQAWVDREVRFGLVRNTDNSRDFRLVPVLGPEADPAALPPFLMQQQWVDLRDSQRAPEQIRRLIEILKSPSKQRAIPENYWTAHSPFRSLQVFEPEDSWLFFGRDSDSNELLSRLGQAPVLAVLGNSGCGKSSLIRAGLIPALHRGRFRSNGGLVDSWKVAVFRPAGAPFDELTKSLLRDLGAELSIKERGEFVEYCREKLPQGGDALRNAVDITRPPKGAHILLIADQFEEIFTLTANAEDRHRYISALLRAVQLESDVPVHLVLSMRADFYSRCLDHTELSLCLEANLYNVPRMTSAQLRAAIEQRLALAAATAEEGLVDALLADVGEEPGDLALLEHALGQLWERRLLPNNILTNNAYIDIGRLRGALGRHASAVYGEIGDEAEKHLVQRIFLELVQLGEGSQDTRRRVAKEELLALGPPAKMEHLLAHLASSRLINTGGKRGENFVEVSHEALIREWPVLRQWLVENREDLRVERRIAQSAEEWQALGRDAGALLQGARLAQADEWLAKHVGAAELAREFVETSKNAQAEATRKERDAQQREITHQQELRRQAEARAIAEQHAREVAEQLRKKDHSATVRLRWFSIVLACSLLIAIGTTWFARRQQSIAESRALTVQAEEILTRDQPEALNLALKAWQTARTSEAHNAIAKSFPQMAAILQGHTSSVLSAAFSPDGQRIVTASYDKTARVWNAASGQLLATLQGHTDRVRNAEFSPNGERIVTASEDKTARVWNAANGQLLVILQGHTGPVENAAFSPDGQRIVTVSATLDRTARVWNAASGQLMTTLQMQSPSGTVVSAVFSPDGQRIVTASYNGTALVWNAASGQLLSTLQGHTGYVENAVFSPDGLRIVTASADKTARVWNATSGQLLATLQGHTDRVESAVFSPNGERIVTASADTTARLWNAANGQLLATLPGHSKTVWSAVFSPDGQRIVTASADTTARVWNAANGQLLATLQGHTRTVNSGVFSPDGKRIVTASDDTTARLWNVAASVQLLTALQGHTDVVRSAEFSPDAKRIVTASDDKTARLWNAANGQLLTTLKGHTGPVESAVFSPDGERIVTASDDTTARVWNAANGQLLATLQGHTDTVWSAVFSHDAQRIVTAGDKTARVWNAANGQLLATLQGHSDIVGRAAFSPDGQRIVTASEDKTARLWNAGNGQLLATLQGHSDIVFAAVFSADGQRIVTAGDDETARVWNVSGELLTTLQGHTGRVIIAVFSADGQRILTASFDKTARVWNAANGQLLAILQGHTGRVWGAMFSPNDERIVTAGDDKTARVSRAVTLSEIAELLAK